MTRGAFAQLWLVRQLQLYLDSEDLAMLVHVTVTSRLDNCNMLYIGLPFKTVWKLQLVKMQRPEWLSEVGDLTQTTSSAATLAANFFLDLIQGAGLDLYSYKLYTAWGQTI